MLDERPLSLFDFDLNVFISSHGGPSGAIMASKSPATLKVFEGHNALGKL
jgi:hypothetical protein